MTFQLLQSVAYDGTHTRVFCQTLLSSQGLDCVFSLIQVLFICYLLTPGCERCMRLKNSYSIYPHDLIGSKCPVYTGPGSILPIRQVRILSAILFHLV